MTVREETADEKTKETGVGYKSKRVEKLDKKAKREAKKASGKPAKQQTAYWIFLTENREALAKRAGSAKASVVVKLVGEKWKAMPAADKKPFETKAAELQAAYEKALEEWKSSGGDGGERLTTGASLTAHRPNGVVSGT